MLAGPFREGQGFHKGETFDRVVTPVRRRRHPGPVRRYRPCIELKWNAARQLMGVEAKERTPDVDLVVVVADHAFRHGLAQDGGVRKIELIGGIDRVVDRRVRPPQHGDDVNEPACAEVAGLERFDNTDVL